jgi:hypothetical protein
MMINSRSAGAYNSKTVIIIFTAQGLKVFYFFFHEYSIVILGQALCLLIAATVLTFLKFRYPDQRELYRSNPRLTELDSTIPRFFLPSNAASCCQFVAMMFAYALVVLVLFLVASFVIDQSEVVEFVGLFATLCESLTSLPIVARVVIGRNIQDVSPILIGQYMIGDLLKVGLILVTKAPWVFLLGAICQSSADLVCLLVFAQLRFCRRDGSEQYTLPDGAFEANDEPERNVRME